MAEEQAITNHYDAIVLGVGGVGSAALYHLARRGLRVVGLDRFPPGHSRGSSHGETRAIRKAYFEHPDYVPLLQRAYDNWRSLEQESNSRLLFTVGLLEVGAEDSELIVGVRTAADKYQLPIESVSRAEVQRRYPGFVVPEDYVALVESEGGYLLVEQCVITFIRMAEQYGAELRIGAAAIGWTCRDGLVHVECEDGHYTAQRLVITVFF